MKPRTRPAMARGALVVAAVVALGPGSRADDRNEWVAPARAARKKNPIAADEKSIAQGREVYVRECASCHGDSGKGDGKAAKDLERSPGDLTGAALQQQSDGALFWKTTEGRKPMPSFAKSLSDDERWHVVNYVRSLAPKVDVTPPEIAAPLELRQALSKVFASYAKVASALAKDDATGARTAAEAAKKEIGELAKLEAKALDDKARAAWDEARKTLASRFDELAGASDLVKERELFKGASEALASTLMRFGHGESSPVRLFRCPEANATWLQATREPENPYLGKAKPACGALEKSLAAAKEGKP